MYLHCVSVTAISIGEDYKKEWPLKPLQPGQLYKQTVLCLQQHRKMIVLQYHLTDISSDSHLLFQEHDLVNNLLWAA